MTHDAISERLLDNAAVRNIIESAREEQDNEKSADWLAHNMVAWFSERITVGRSDWEQAFERKKINGKWAYRPSEKS